MSRNWTTAELADLMRRRGVANPIEAACGAPPTAKRSKYNASKKVVDGITFDSAREAKRYMELRLMEAAGEIRNLELQPEFVLQPKMRVDGEVLRAIVYRGDFSYYSCATGKRILEDSKGFRTAVYLMKRKMLLAKFPGIDFREV